MKADRSTNLADGGAPSDPLRLGRVGARRLSTADERRATVLAAAERVYAQRGFASTPTSAVAEAAGISHAYLFRLFPTKSALTLAVVNRCNERLYSAFTKAIQVARAAGDPPLEVIGADYLSLVADPDLLLTHMHSVIAAISDAEVRGAMRDAYARVHALLVEQAGASPEEAGRFLASGAILNTLAALDAIELEAPWVSAVWSALRPATPAA